MKRIFGLVLLLAGLSGGKLCANDTIRWTNAVEYNSKHNEFSFSFMGTEGGTFFVDWGDGNDTTFVYNGGYGMYIGHEYAFAGVYPVRLCATTPDAVITKFGASYITQSLDVSACMSLESLSCSDRRLTTLDVSKNERLTYLDCRRNRLTSLDVSACMSLEYLACSDNQLTSLDVSKNERLTYLNCSDNELPFTAVADIVSVLSEQCSAYFTPQRRLRQTIQPGGGVSAPRRPVIKGTPTHLDIWRDGELLSENRGYTIRGNIVYFDEVGEYKLVLWHDSVREINAREPKPMIYGDTVMLVTVCEDYVTGNDVAYWTSDMLVSSRSVDISISLSGTAGEYFVIDWGDGNRTIVEGTGAMSMYEYQYNCDTIGYTCCLKMYGTAPEARIKKLSINVDLENSDGVSKLDVSACPKLTYLDCHDNRLKFLDISENENLTYLDCSGNFLSVLDVSKNAALVYLNCEFSVLTALDISQNQALMHLECDGNRLSSLDVSKNVDLTYLDCHHNRLSSLDVSQNAALTYLNCGCNQLTSLDVSQNMALEDLYCYGTQLSSLDVSQNENLTVLSCGSNRLTSLDVSKNLALESLECSINYLTSLDVSENVNLMYLYCGDNRLDSLDVSHNEALESLDFANNYLTSLDMSRNMKLRNLYCANNRLTSLDVSRQPKLNEVYCSSNRLTSLDLSAQTRIDYGNFTENFLGVALDESRSFDVSVLPGMDANRILSVQGGRLSGTCLFFEADEVTYLYATGYEGEYSKYRDTVSFRLVADRQAEGQIPLTVEFFPDELFRAYVATFDKDGNDSLCRYERAAVKKIDVGGGSETFVYWKRDIQSLEGLQYFENLETLICNANDLKSLDVSRNPALREIYCTHNRLTSLEVVDKPALRYFSCHNNELESLRVIGCPVLEDIVCPNNRLTHLEMRDCPALEWMSCANNQLKQLDISGLPGLEELLCFCNHLSEVDASANPYLRDIDCGHNAISLSAVATLRTDLRRNGASVDEMGLSPQRIPVVLRVGETLDLRPEMFLEGCVTDIDFGATSESAYTFSDGVVKFNETGTYEIRLSNETMQNWAHDYWFYGDNYVDDIGVTEGAVAVFYDITVKRGGVRDPSDPGDEPDEPLTPPTDPDDPGVANEDLALAAAAWAYVSGRTIYVTDAVDVRVDEVSVYTAVGQLVYRGHGRAVEVPQAGVYILTAGERRMKVLVR